MKILFAEDSPMIARQIKGLLEMNGHVVDHAENGQDALKRVMCDGDYDLIISDLDMPKLNGIQFMGLARATGTKTPAVLYTGEMGLNEASFPDCRFDKVFEKTEVSKLLEYVTRKIKP